MAGGPSISPLVIKQSCDELDRLAAIDAVLEEFGVTQKGDFSTTELIRFGNKLRQQNLLPPSKEDADGK